MGNCFTSKVRLESCGISGRGTGWGGKLSSFLKKVKFDFISNAPVSKMHSVCLYFGRNLGEYPVRVRTREVV